MVRKSIVFVSNIKYSPKYRELLKNIIFDGAHLFCTVGKYCDEWEEAMDYVCVELDVNGEKPGAFCVTTSHPGESQSEVIKFAKEWKDDEGKSCRVEVIEI